MASTVTIKNIKPDHMEICTDSEYEQIITKGFYHGSFFRPEEVVLVISPSKIGYFILAERFESDYYPAAKFSEEKVNVPNSMKLRDYKTEKD
jgi:hypothetical protein